MVKGEVNGIHVNAEKVHDIKKDIEGGTVRSVPRAREVRVGTRNNIECQDSFCDGKDR